LIIYSIYRKRRSWRDHGYIPFVVITMSTFMTYHRFCTRCY